MTVNNFSSERLLYLKKKKNNSIITHLTRVLILVGLIVSWELLARFEIIDSFLMSMPSKILKTLYDLTKSGELFMHVGITLYETL